MRAERFDEAAAQFEEALHKDPALAEARMNLAICRFQLRDYTEARKLLNDSKRPLAKYYLGRLELIEGNLDAAVADLGSLRRVLDGKYYLASAYCKQGQFSQALRPLREWIQADPRDFRAHQLLARALRELGRQREANREFARTKELHEYYTQGSVDIASCRTLLSQGKAGEAWSACQPMLNTNDADKAAAIGMLFGQANDREHSRMAWEKALTLDPESPEVNYNFALACFQLRDMGRARTYAKNSLALWPEFPEANVLYGTVLYMAGEDAEARRVLSHALALRPGDETVARLLRELGAR